MKCPKCKKEAEEKFKPFCSKRCADLDLHSWFSGEYGIPSEEEPEEAEIEQLMQLVSGDDQPVH